MKLSHILESQQFSRELLEDFFLIVERMKKICQAGGSYSLSGKRMVILFYGPSIRTHASFAMAMDRLGGKVVFSTENAGVFSSVTEGGSLEDTIKIFSSWHPDVVVLRTNEEGMAERAATVSAAPIINAGDGTGQHPTQALIDLYTIYEKLGTIDGLSIVIAGDLATGRTARSLAYFLGKFSVKQIYFVSPDVVRMREDVKDYLKRHKVPFWESNDLRQVAPLADVIYQTRTTQERKLIVSRYGPNGMGYYVVDQEVLRLMRLNSFVLHPFPRSEEMPFESDQDSRAVYFDQAQNALYVRMALLTMVCSDK
ncbi:MAG: aspartate carbamoyltransferase [Candidatus Berkelbacteria bacterium]|nr:aspartate carbamoyltransferase [Candidatus Berkelbacteria bacterium]